MSWIEKLENTPCKITTGDGRSYEPLWREAKRSRAYNHAAYSFANVSGTLVDRRLPEGNQYDLTLMFTGPSHLDTASAFSASADDSRPWTFVHPFWGSVTVQPVSIEEDKTNLNVSIFRVRVWETIPRMHPWPKRYAADRVTASREELTELSSESFEARNPVVTSGLRSTLTETTRTADNVISPKLTTDKAFADFKTGVAAANRAINDATKTPADVMRAILWAINYPIRNIASVKDRLSVLSELYGALTDRLDGASDAPTLSVFESTAGAVCGAMADTVVHPSDGDYSTRPEAVAATETLSDVYAGYLNVIEAATSERSDTEGAYTPDDAASRALRSAVTEAAANVYEYALGAKQERAIYLEEDSNAVVQAHRFYGLDRDDVNLNYFIGTNRLSMDELICIKKGRKLLYYK